MICQSAISSWSHFTSSSSRSVWLRTRSVRDGTPTRLSRASACSRAGPADAWQMAPAPVRTRLAPDDRWQDVPHDSGLLERSEGFRPGGARRPSAGRADHRADHHARFARPHMRDGLAYPTLATWVDRGVYDDLIVGLGDGMAAGLTVGLGEQDTDSVFRRAFSVLVLAECIDRDNQEDLVPAGKLLEWGDRIASWYLREQDVRGYVPGKGWAHAVAHGADASACWPARPLRSQRAHRPPRRDRRPGAGAGRVGLRPRRAGPDGDGHDDRAPPQRGPAVGRRALGRPPRRGGRAAFRRRGRPVPGTANAQAFLRALHLQLASRRAPRRPARPAARRDVARCGRPTRRTSPD